MSKLFLGGVPVKPNVDALMEQIQAVAGEVYSHEDIARIADTRYKTHRYRTIIAAWKSRLIREKGLDLAAENGVGYRVLHDGERISYGNREAVSGLRKIKRGGDKAMRAEDHNLTDAERRQRMQLMRMSADIIKIGREGQHEFTVLGKTKEIR